MDWQTSHDTQGSTYKYVGYDILHREVFLLYFDFIFDWSDYFDYFWQEFKVLLHLFTSLFPLQ